MLCNGDAKLISMLKASTFLGGVELARTST
jgi:hypothetical protein